MPFSTLYLIDDDDAICRALESVAELLQVRLLRFSSAEKFLQTDLKAAEGCAIVDLKLPGMNGIELQEAMRQRSCDLPVIVISGHADVPLAVEAMRRGAIVVLEKPFSFQRLRTHIQEALELHQARRKASEVRDLARKRLATLTSREREVVDFIAQGQTNKQIAGQLHLTLRAIEDRRARLMRRVGVTSLAELLTLLQQAEFDEQGAP